MTHAPQEMTVDLQPVAELDQTLGNLVDLGEQFRGAAAINDPTEAQRITIVALKEFGDIFVTRDLGIHDLLTSIQSLLMNSRLGTHGREPHFLLRGSQPIIGSSRVAGQDMVRGCAISAVTLLMERTGAKKLPASCLVAEWLTNAGFSSKKDDDYQPCPVAGTTVRRWFEKSDDYPLAHCLAAELRKNHMECLEYVDPADHVAIKGALRNKVYALKEVLVTLQ